MIERSLACLGRRGFYRLAYYEWPGPADAPTVLCLHGLTRNGHDFDVLAESLSAEFRVVALDFPGRGKSDWLADPHDYVTETYAADVAALIARLGVERIDIVGTSMGGIVGMALAAQRNNPIRKLVINDVGPLIAKAGLKRIRRYVGRDPSFKDLAELEAALRWVFAGFGMLTDGTWRRMAEQSARSKPDGTLGFNYDPKIAVPFKRGWFVRDVKLWNAYDAITCPTLVLRGADSDILRRADAEAMTRRGPRAKLVEFSGMGHAPSLTVSDQIACVRNFLRG
ncbi:MAG: alpha/beta hydrolase [Alphaproteobacteria bacterium]|nr:alpha/beta hydrolase [Alphaproteobacteria bacterium]